MILIDEQTNPHEFVSSGWDDTMQFWDARCPNAVRSAPDIMVGKVFRADLYSFQFCGTIKSKGHSKMSF